MTKVLYFGEPCKTLAYAPEKCVSRHSVAPLAGFNVVMSEYKYEDKTVQLTCKGTGLIQTVVIYIHL